MKHKLSYLLAACLLVLVGCNKENQNESKRSLLVSWVDDQGEILEEKNIRVSKKHDEYDYLKYEYSQTTPTKMANAEYSYSFNGWSKGIFEEDNHLVFTAIFKSFVNEYTIEWHNYNGEIIRVDNNVPYGTMPRYYGVLPKKESTQAYSYTFAGWSPAVVTVESDAVYTAVFSEEKINYIIYLDYCDGTSNISKININYGSDYELPIPTRKGYEFINWIDKNGNIFDNDGVWNCNSNITLYANWNLMDYSITYNLNGGNFVNSLYLYIPYTYTVLSGAVIPIPYRTGYNFVRWQNSSGETVYDIEKGQIGNVVLDAIWQPCKYNVTVISQDDNKGVVSYYNSEYDFDSQIELIAVPKSGYEFDGWYISDTDKCLSMSKTYSYNVRSYNIVICAHWKTTIYEISYELNGGTNSQSNPNIYTIENEVLLYSPTKQGCTFVGWSYNGQIINKIPKGTSGNITLTAIFSEDHYNIVVNKNVDGGQISGDGTYLYGEEVCLVASANENFVFKGWFSDSNQLLCESAEYSFIANSSLSISAIFWSSEENSRVVEEKNLGKLPNIISEDQLTYGVYPQKVILDNQLIDNLNNLDNANEYGWYFYEGKYYVKKSSIMPYWEDNRANYYYFHDGTLIRKNTKYWFECNPIQWTILKKTDNIYYLVSTAQIDLCVFNSETSTKIIDGVEIKPSNYAYSDIREWLNNDFYNSFTIFGDGFIKSTEIDNSGFSVNNNGWIYDFSICENTIDKVFLRSRVDALVDKSMSALTDYAKILGGYYSTSYEAIAATGDEHLRSAYDADNVYRLTSTNSISYNPVDYKRFVRPCIVMEIDDIYTIN